MASHLIRCGTQVSPLGVPGWLSLSNYKPSTQSTSSSSRNADKTVQFKRVKQSPNISQNKIVCGILCGFVMVLCRVGLDTFQSFLQEGVVSSKGTCLNASREYFPRFPRRTVKHCKVFLHLYQHDIQAPQDLYL